MKTRAMVDQRGREIYPLAAALSLEVILRSSDAASSYSRPSHHPATRSVSSEEDTA